MLKKFVPLNSNASPSKNPYEVRTYMGDNTTTPDWKVDVCTKRPCEVPPNSMLSKVITIEDELRRLHQKAKDSRFQRSFKAKCEATDDFTMCVVPQRTTKELKTHAVMRERYLRTQYNLQRRVHDAAEMIEAAGQGIVQLNSPIQQSDEEEEAESEGDEDDDDNLTGSSDVTRDPYSDDSDEENRNADGKDGKKGKKKKKKPVKPKVASPDCSLDMIFMPPQKLLELKRPKSGMYHNETDRPPLEDDDIPYNTYNPRVLQAKLDDQCLNRIDLIEGRDPNDLWTWNIGYQKRESELDRAVIEATIPKLDCNNMELTVYKIPKNLEKTFTAEIVFANETVALELPRNKPSFYNRPREIACLFVAYVESFRLNPDFWTAETMDAILLLGEKLRKKSENLNYKATDMDFDVISTITEKQATIDIKIHFTGPLKNEPNIYKALSLYFSKYNAALLCSKNIYLLIWKRCSNSFYVFDPNGRNELCQRDFENGKCSLMATRYVEHLVHLIVNFSEADMDSEFNLYEIFLTGYGKITTPLPSKPLPKRTRKLWAVVNDNFAVIPGDNNGLQSPITGNEHNASMIISMLALLYSDIERASLWRMEVVDDLIKFGQSYYKSIVKRLKLKKTQHLNIVDLPEMIMMGAFKATLKKRPFLYTGHVADCKSFLDSQLTAALKELFTSKWEAALLQIDNSIIALWRDMEYFYVFDPFRRGKAGQVLDPEDFLTKGVACLQMHTNFESFCRILYQKALKMRRGGKFFLHGVNVGCIKPIVSAAGIRNKYTRLRLTYPKYSDEPEAVRPSQAKKGKKDKKKKLGTAHSIHTIPDEDLIPMFEDIDIVDGVLEEILCDIFQTMEEPMPTRAAPYKQADKVLLRSDKPYLEALKYDLKHGNDPDNIYSAFRTHPDTPPHPLTLEEEMQIPSNYCMLPDGTWVIFGSSQLPMVNDEMSKLAGLLAGLVTAALTAKYKISTWNFELIEYALESANSFGDDYQTYATTLAAVLSKTLPQISIGQNTYMLKVQKIIKSAITRSLRQVLLESLINYNRLMVICQRFSCVIIKRYNFLYMFIGFPCNTVGYRKFGSGPGCMLRFVELDSLIRRIEFGCNPQGCEITNYVAVALKVVDVTQQLPDRFRKWPQSDEDAMYATELEKHDQIQQNKMLKIQFLDTELRKEDNRIQKFLKAKEDRREKRRQARADRCKKGKKGTRPVKMRTRFGSEEDEEEEMEEEMEAEDEFEEEEEEIALKHKPGKRLKREIPDRFKPRPILYGYRMREKDCLFKIQGSLSLEGRGDSSLEQIKTCFFTSTLAILYAIIRPINQWSSQRIDRVIESGNAIASRVTNMTTAFERVIKNVTVDEYEFDVWAKTFEPAGVYGGTVNSKIAKATQTRRYMLLQISNGTFAIYRDEYFHLFDPYGSMETITDGEEEEDEGDDEVAKPTDEEAKETKKKCPKGVKKYGERNTASWVLFVDVDCMIKYINKRAANSRWKTDNEYKFHVVDVLSYKKASPKTRMLQLLTDLSVPMHCKITQHGEDESAICAHNETLSWLDLENCLPVWSRINRRNTAGRYRNLPLSKLKKYDVEITGRLWSLWGNLHPQAPVFDSKSRGKQFLACNVMACCAAMIYRLTDWSAQLLDTIVISGDKYHRDSLANIKQEDYEFSLEDLNLECRLEKIKFVVHLEHVAYGYLYAAPTLTKMNMAEALMYFFGHFQFGILQCHKRSLAIGRTLGHDGGYFMFDCQNKDHPLFPKGQGASYVLRTKHLQVLLYCIVVTLNISYFNVYFTLHKVEMLREGASVEDDEEGEEEQTE